MNGWKTYSKLFMETKYSLIADYGNSKLVSNLLGTTNWTSFLDNQNVQGYGQYAIGGPTLEMWCDSWNTYLKTNKDSVFKEIRPENTDTYGYKISSDILKNQYSLSVRGTQNSNGVDFDMLRK